MNRGEEKVRVHMNVVPRSTLNTNGGTETRFFGWPIVVLKTSNFRGVSISRQFLTETLYCLNSAFPRRVPRWIVVVFPKFWGKILIQIIIKFLR